MLECLFQANNISYFLILVIFNQHFWNINTILQSKQTVFKWNKVNKLPDENDF